MSPERGGTWEHRKISVGLLFGGRSAEHEVSRASAANVLRALNPDRYDVFLIGISRDGRWLACDAGNGAGTGAAALSIPDDAPQVALIPGGQGRVVRCDGGDARAACHLASTSCFRSCTDRTEKTAPCKARSKYRTLPYVGSAVTGSAAAMDKDVAKRLMRDAGLPVVPFVTSHAGAQMDYRAAAAALDTTDLFVKPANMGSSVGVSRARSEEEFAAACEAAFRYDTKLLIERCVSGAREIECSVLEDAGGELRASQLGEIVPASKHGFYSYQAKYIDAEGADLRIPADLTAQQASRFQDLAIRTFRVLGCEGMARVDFFLAGE